MRMTRQGRAEAEVEQKAHAERWLEEFGDAEED